MWRRHWWSLTLAQLVAYTVPGAVAVAMGAALGLFPDGIQEPLRVVLLDQFEGSHNWTGRGS